MITISSYEPGNRAGSLTGTKFVVCVYTVNSSLTDTLVSRQLYLWQCRSRVKYIGGAQHECRRRELLGGSGGMPPQEIFISRVSKHGELGR